MGIMHRERLSGALLRRWVAIRLSALRLVSGLGMVNDVKEPGCGLCRNM